MPGSLLIVVSYILLTVFLVAFLVRTIRIARLPVHLRWELAPVPHEKGKGQYGGSYFEEYEWWTKPREKSLAKELTYMFEEIVFLKGVWEHNRRLWWFSLPFHIGMYMLSVGAALLGIGVVFELVGVASLSWAPLRTVVLILASAGFALGGVGALGLLVRRVTDPRLKDFTPPAALFNLVLLLGVFVSGGCALATSDFFAGVSAFAKALFTANLGIETPAILGLHVVVAMLFLAYLPFSTMMHFVAKYFTYHEVRWDDEPLQAGGRMEKEVLGLLKQPVTWSGPHLKADGRKNWVDIATEEKEK